MTTTPACTSVSALPPSLLSVSPEQLATVTGGGIGSQIGTMFGADGAKWGNVADSIFSMVGGALPSGSGSGGGGGGGGGFNIGSLLSSFGGLGGGNSSSSPAPAQTN